jgi:hypothetical protein
MSTALDIVTASDGATLPVNYERAKEALRTCSSIDECKDWADKMAALASYAKQADDMTLHNLATRISARAIRRAGDLLKTFENEGAGAGRPPKSPVGNHSQLPEMTRRRAADAAGLSPHQELQAVRVANVPAEEFEAALESDTPATVTKLAEMGKTSRPRTTTGFIEATQALGLIHRCADFCGTYDASFIVGGVTPAERPEAVAQLQSVMTWFRTFSDQLQKGAAG